MTDSTLNTQSPSLIKDLAFECVKRRTNNQVELTSKVVTDQHGERVIITPAKDGLFHVSSFHVSSEVA